MNKFRVLERSQNFMTRLAISSHRLSEPTNEFFTRFMAYYITFLLFAFSAASGGVVYKYWPDLSLVLQGFAMVLAGLQCGGVYVSIGFQMKNIKKLNNELQTIVDKEHNEDILEIYWGVEKKCRWRTLIVTCFVFWNESAFIGPLLYSFYCIWSGDYNIAEWNLPFFIVVPFDTTNLLGWYLLWLYQFNVSLFYSSSFTVITSFFMSCCLYIGGICEHFDFLCDSIMKDVELNRVEKDPKKQHERNQQMRENTGRMIQIHVKMFDVFKILTEINSGSLFWLLSPNIIFLALNLYAMENTSFEVLEFFFQIIVVFVSLLWIILHCYYADWTTDRMEEIKYKIYDSKWFELPVELQKMSTLVISRSQGLLRFNGLGIVYCTLETLGKVFKSSVSYYMVFRGLADS